MCDILEYPDSMKYPIREQVGRYDTKISEIVRELADGSIQHWFVFQDKLTDEFYRVLMITTLS